MQHIAWLACQRDLSRTRGAPVLAMAAARSRELRTSALKQAHDLGDLHSDFVASSSLGTHGSRGGSVVSQVLASITWASVLASTASIHTSAMRAARRMRLFALALLLLAAVSVPGCGGGSKSTSTSGRLAVGAEATACAALNWELKRFQAANNAAEKESNGSSGSVLTSIEGIKGVVKQLVNSPDVALSQKARVVEETLSAYERQGQESVIQHLTGKQPWKAGTPTLTELCP